MDGRILYQTLLMRDMEEGPCSGSFCVSRQFDTSESLISRGRIYRDLRHLITTDQRSEDSLIQPWERGLRVVGKTSA